MKSDVFGDDIKNVPHQKENLILLSMDMVIELLMTGRFFTRSYDDGRS
jgi:hypothetical protein